MDTEPSEVLEDELEPQPASPEAREAQAEEEEEVSSLLEEFIKACTSYEEEQSLTALALQYEVRQEHI